MRYVTWIDVIVLALGFLFIGAIISDLSLLVAGSILLAYSLIELLFGKDKK